MALALDATLPITSPVEEYSLVYLQLSYGHVAERLGDLAARGVTFAPGQTLLDLYNERCPLYEQYAHIILPCDGKSIDEIVRMIRARL